MVLGEQIDANDSPIFTLEEMYFLLKILGIILKYVIGFMKSTSMSFNKSRRYRSVLFHAGVNRSHGANTIKYETKVHIDVFFE